MSLSQLPIEWRSWLLGSLQRGCKPADLLRSMNAHGAITAQVAMAALTEARHNSRDVHLAGPDSATVAAAPWLDSRQRTMAVPGHQVDVRVVLSQPDIVVMDHLLTPAECAAMCRLAQSAVLTQSPGDDPVLSVLERRVSALAHWPLSHFEPFQFSRFAPDDVDGTHGVGADFEVASNTHPVGDASGSRVGLFVVVLEAPQTGGGIAVPQADGLRVMPCAGSALWIQQRTHHDGHVSHGAPAVVDPVRSGVAWLATVGLRESAWRHAQA